MAQPHRLPVVHRLRPAPKGRLALYECRPSEVVESGEVRPGAADLSTYAGVLSIPAVGQRAVSRETAPPSRRGGRGHRQEDEQQGSPTNLQALGPESITPSRVAPSRIADALVIGGSSLR